MKRDNKMGVEIYKFPDKKPGENEEVIPCGVSESDHDDVCK